MITKKINIRILVQDAGEDAENYAKRLEKYCNNLTIDGKTVAFVNPQVTFTTASNGRQTANIIYYTSM